MGTNASETWGPVKISYYMSEEFLYLQTVMTYKKNHQTLWKVRLQWIYEKQLRHNINTEFIKAQKNIKKIIYFW
jgi:hypothetical protein